MAGFLHYCFIVDKSHITEAVLSKLLVELCEVVGSTPNNFGSYAKEPPHQHLELTAKEAVKELLEDGSIFLESKTWRGLFTIDYGRRTCVPRDPRHWELAIVTDHGDLDRFFGAAKEVYKIVHPRYGAGVLYSTDSDDGGSAIEFASRAHPEEFLYNQMFFSPELVESIGRKKMEATPGAEITMLEDGGIFLEASNETQVAKHLALFYSHYEPKLDKTIVEDYRKK